MLSAQREGPRHLAQRPRKRHSAVSPANAAIRANGPDVHEFRGTGRRRPARHFQGRRDTGPD
eukprot:11170202-Lingulodinium_polyedra.AAC.1